MAGPVRTRQECEQGAGSASGSKARLGPGHQPVCQSSRWLGRWLGRWPGRVALALTLLLAVHAGLGATALEHRVKAAYLYNFFLFVDWPSQSPPCADDCFELCIIGTNPLGENLSALTRKTAQERPIRLRRLRSGADPSGCHVLVIGDSATGGLRQILRQAQRAHVLTVSEMPNFASRGGMIGFTLEDGKVRLEVNMDSIQRAGLRVSSKLLEVAAEVHGR